jgi:S1-C subfamily serine protease
MNRFFFLNPGRTPFFLRPALIGALFVLMPFLHLQAATHADFAWENSIILIHVAAKEYNYIQPWERSKKMVFKTGVVVNGHLIITTAEGLADQAEIRVKKQGDGLYSEARLVWIDYQSNLAALTTDEKDFWTGLQPAQLADPVPITGQVRILRWNEDLLENRQGEIERFTVENSALSFVSVPVLKIDSTIPAAGYGEAVTVGDKLIGLACAQGGDAVTAIPASFIARILKAQQAGTYTGLGYFDFTWDPAENPLNLDYLKLPGPARGVIVRETGLKPGVVSQVHSGDVILQIDGFDIDAEGNYRDPDYKKLCLENLSSRGKWAGMTCKLKIWRDGKEQTIVYQLPKAEYSDELVPEQLFDQAPEYVLAGGFVFVPLSQPYLRSWGPNWRQVAPFRLSYFATDKVTPERPQRVVLSQVLPYTTNMGYESMRNTVIDEINGIKIKRIEDVLTALKTPVNGFDVFKFESGEPVQEAVLDASNMDEVTQDIMTRYHILNDHVLNEPPAPVVQK